MRKAEARNKTKGMLLIEAVTVITIAIVLTGIVFVAIRTAQRKGRDTDRLADLNGIRKALSLYISDKGIYPPGEAIELGREDARSLCDNGWSAECQGKHFMLRVPHSLARVNGGCGVGQDKYLYYQGHNGHTYEIVFCFEGEIGRYDPGLHKADHTGIK